MSRHAVLLCFLLLAAPASSSASHGSNPVTDWAAIVQQAIHNAEAPRSPGTSQVLHAMVQLAVYDAVVAIKGGYRPYAVRIKHGAGADVRAAVATAAYTVTRARAAASQIPYLDQRYATYMAGIPGGRAKAHGIRVGSEAAAAILILRAKDGFSNVVLYQCSAVPPPIGEFEPDTGCPSGQGSAQPVDVKLGQILPFTIRRADKYRPDGPDPMTSVAYAKDFEETRDYGRANSTLRTPEQTDIAYFWSEHPYVHWNRNLIALATSQGLDALDAARFFAMVHTSVADAIIAGFQAKYHYAFWRPRTAIPQADYDDNPDTIGDSTWTPLLRVNHPEYPSGHGFWSTALTDAVAAFFQTESVTWTITTSQVAVPQVVKAERTYHSMSELMEEITNARIWGGLHWRFSMYDGAKIGRRVAAHVTTHYFQPTGRH
jgi:hypothetical protein